MAHRCKRTVVSDFDLYLIDIGKIPQLTHKEEKKLGVLSRAGNIEARNRLITSNLKLVVAQARRYSKPNNLTIADLVAEGNVGLIRAAELYNPKVGTTFSTYAVPWIRQAMGRAIDCNYRIHIPVYMIQYIRNTQNGRDTSCKTASVPENKRKQYARDAAIAMYNSFSIDNSFISDDRPGPLYSLEVRELHNRLLDAVASLGEPATTIVTMRHGLSGDKPLEFDDIGRRLKMTKQKARLINKKSIDKLANIILDYTHED